MADAKSKQFKRFQKLTEYWRNDMMSRGREELFKQIADAAIKIVASETAKQFDEDINRLKEELATANEGYKETKKTQSLKIEFLIETLRSQGVDVPSLQDFISGAARGELDDDGEIEVAETKAAESHHRVDKLVADAAKKIAKGLGKGSSLTISVPGAGRSATIEGEGDEGPPEDEERE